MWNLHYLIALNDLLRATRAADIKLHQLSGQDRLQLGIFIDLDGDSLRYEIEEETKVFERGFGLGSSALERFKLSEELLTPFQQALLAEQELSEDNEAGLLSCAVREYVFDKLQVIEIVSRHDTRDYIVAEYKVKGALTTRVATVELRGDYSRAQEVMVAAKCVRSGYELQETKGSGIVVVYDTLGKAFSWDIPSRSCECKRFQRHRSCEHHQLAMQFTRTRQLYSCVRR